MKFRYARHTSDLQRIEKFYTEIVGFEKLGGFKDHNKYDGIFLGFHNQQWHLEFTVSNERSERIFDDDDILVFYVASEVEIIDLQKRLNRHNINMEIPKNPYWKEKGIMISDPDGHKIVFTQ